MVIFGFGSAARTKAVASLLGKLAALLEGMHPVELAAVLMLANAHMALISRSYGQAVVLSPVSDIKAALAAMDEMLSLHELSDAVVEAAAPNFLRYLTVHSVAVMVVVSTLAIALSASQYRPPAASAWKAIWAARSRSDAALIWLRRAESASGVACFPAMPSRPSDLDILGFAQSLPACMRGRKSPARPDQASKDGA